MSKLTLPSGSVIEGTPAEISSILAKVDTLSHLPGFYRSESKGYIAIKDMHPLHLRNAIAKTYRAWVDELNELTPYHFIRAVKDGITNPEFLEMCKTLFAKAEDV
jgi:hypothetical protein